MALYVASINSGSNGNCYYIGNGNEAVLVDAGISCREIERRMQKLGLDMNGVKAIFISHEHGDHIKGVEVLSKKHSIPVFISERTLRNSGLKLQAHLTESFENRPLTTLGGLRIKAFQKHHDAADPYSFNITCNDITVGVYTDIGHVCRNVISHFKECHAVFLEANYDEEMLETGQYPAYLKRRIQSDRGHLSNAQALELFNSHRPAQLSHVFLAHLSKENNSPQLVQQLFTAHAGATQVVVASRHHESDLYFISGSPVAPQAHALTLKQAARTALKINATVPGAGQMSLF